MLANSPPRLPPLAPVQPAYIPHSPRLRPDYQNVPTDHHSSRVQRDDQSTLPRLPHVTSFDRIPSHEFSVGHSRPTGYQVEQPLRNPAEVQRRPWLEGNQFGHFSGARLEAASQYNISHRSSDESAAGLTGSFGYRPSINPYRTSVVPLSGAPTSSRLASATEDMQESTNMTSRYNLTIRQQPIAARACGLGERDRRVVDPPPIIQLSLTNYNPSSKQDVDALRTLFNVLHCSLIDPSGRDVTTIQDPHDAKKMSRRLMGTLVASPFIGTDPSALPSGVGNARLGCFFIFPDLSCRQSGHYRLRFTLMQVNLGILPTGSSSNLTVGLVESEIFEVFSAKDFPGMRPSTALTKELKRQGAAVSVKKGNEPKPAKKGQKRDSSISEENASEGSLQGSVSAQRRKL
ncbi:MAG: hypothetical protein LQ342_004185 [Letrouitia transgressa]|nr:MAG: hypothetical protein LQ342_004185 [Letrouitia transgressa]